MIKMHKRFRDTEYYVSSEGTVISRYSIGGIVKDRVVGRGKTNGYHCIKPKRKSGWLVHQMVMELYGNDCPGKGYVIDHIDEDKTNNNINNLQWITRGDNVRKSEILTKRSRKLSQDDANEIRKKYQPRRYTRDMLSEEYGVSLSTIKSILKHQYY